MHTVTRWSTPHHTLHQHSGILRLSACMQANVKTLSVRLGVKTVFWACIVLLELAYAGAIGLGVLSQVRHGIKTYADHAAHHRHTFLLTSYLDPSLGCI